MATPPSVALFGCLWNNEHCVLERNLFKEFKRIDPKCGNGSTQILCNILDYYDCMLFDYYTPLWIDDIKFAQQVVAAEPAKDAGSAELHVIFERMKNEKSISAISLTLGLIFLFAAYLVPRIFDKMYYVADIFHLFILILAIIGLILVFISTYLCPKIGILPLMLLLLLIMSNVSVTHRGTLDKENRVSTTTYKGWPFQIYESTSIIDPSDHEIFNERYIYKGIILDISLALAIVSLLSIRKLKNR